METDIIYNEECLQGLKKLKSKSVDLVFTSPPYNMRTRIRNGQYTTREKSEHFSKKYAHFDDALPIDEFYRFHKQVLKELLRVSKVVCYNFQIVTGSKEAFFKIIGDFNKHIKDIIIWDKGHGQPAMHEKVTNSCYEFILVLEDDLKAGRVIQNATFERGLFNNILRIGRPKKISKEHSAVFPVKLAEEIISNFSKKGDIVLDPFIGSGTTAVACKKLHRKYIGFEISPEYCKIISKRLSQQTLSNLSATPRTLPNGNSDKSEEFNMGDKVSATPTPKDASHPSHHPNIKLNKVSHLHAGCNITRK